MANIRTWLEEAEEALDDTIIAIVVGEHDDPEREKHPKMGQILTREEGLQILDEDFNNSYGSPDCYRILAWSGKRVFFVDEYDGATSLGWTLRNPTECTPGFGGDVDEGFLLWKYRKQNLTP